MKAQCVVVLLISAVVLAQESLPHVAVSGTHYQVGYQVGKSQADRIQKFVSIYPTLSNVLIPFYNTAHGKQVYNEFVATNSKLYPKYVDEIKGLSDGSQVPLYKLMLMALKAELEAVASNQTTHSHVPISDLSCSDILVNGGGNLIDGHNEDADTTIKALAYIVTAQFTDDDGYWYTAYTYPGFISGIAFGFNSYGISCAFNWVGPIPAVVGGAARQFINRDVLSSKNVEDAIAKVTVPNRAYGFSMNLGSYKEQRVMNVEVSPNAFTVFEVLSFVANYSHFNMYRNLAIPQVYDPSSVHRLARADQMAAPTTVKDVVTILGDTKDQQYPIYRGPNTVASGVFDLTAKTLHVYLANPKLSAPVMAFDMTSDPFNQ